MQETQRTDVFDLISALENSLPLGKDKIEHVIGTTLNVASENEYFLFLEGTGSRLADGSEVDNIDLRLSKSNSAKIFLSFQVKRRCISPAMVRAHYGNLKLVDVPRGRSHDEETTFTTVDRSVRLGFGFKESRPECLSTVVLEQS
jgi:hypothetical protein